MHASSTLKVAILDLYGGYPNLAISSFVKILELYQTANHIRFAYQVFEVRSKARVPDISFDIYLSSGGPGSPIDSEGAEWETRYFDLIDRLNAHNQLPGSRKKYMLLICHSFQLICRRLQLGEVCLRHSPLFGVEPVHLTEAGKQEYLFNGLNNPFYAIDSRSWQVINITNEQLNAAGATLLAIENEYSNGPYPRAAMAIRFNEYLIATQFHPEADAPAMKAQFITEEKKQQMISEYGEQKYRKIMSDLDDPDKISLTQHTIIPNFLSRAIKSLNG